MAENIIDKIEIGDVEASILGATVTKEIKETQEESLIVTFPGNIVANNIDVNNVTASEMTAVKIQAIDSFVLEDPGVLRIGLDENDSAIIDKAFIKNSVQWTDNVIDFEEKSIENIKAINFYNSNGDDIDLSDSLTLTQDSDNHQILELTNTSILRGIQDGIENNDAATVHQLNNIDLVQPRELSEEQQAQARKNISAIGYAGGTIENLTIAQSFVAEDNEVSFDFGGNPIANVGSPINQTDAANKAYVDSHRSTEPYMTLTKTRKKINKDDTDYSTIVTLNAYNLIPKQEYQIQLYTNNKEQGREYKEWKHLTSEKTGYNALLAGKTRLKHGTGENATYEKFPSTPSFMQQNIPFQTSWTFTPTTTFYNQEIVIKDWIIPYLKPITYKVKNEKGHIMSVGNIIEPTISDDQEAKVIEFGIEFSKNIENILTASTYNFLPSNSANIQLIRNESIYSIGNTKAVNIRYTDKWYLDLQQLQGEMIKNLTVGDKLVISGRFSTSDNQFSVNIEKTSLEITANGISVTASSNIGYSETEIPYSSDGKCYWGLMSIPAHNQHTAAVEFRFKLQDINENLYDCKQHLKIGSVFYNNTTDTVDNPLKIGYISIQ